MLSIFNFDQALGLQIPEDFFSVKYFFLFFSGAQMRSPGLESS
jgi:hypothetical protein